MLGTIRKRIQKRKTPKLYGLPLKTGMALFCIKGPSPTDDMRELMVNRVIQLPYFSLPISCETFPVSCSYYIYGKEEGRV
jgi:hypothetical protein